MAQPLTSPNALEAFPGTSTDLPNPWHPDGLEFPPPWYPECSLHHRWHRDLYHDDSAASHCAECLVRPSTAQPPTCRSPATRIDLNCRPPSPRVARCSIVGTRSLSRRRRSISLRRVPCGTVPGTALDLPTPGHRISLNCRQPNTRITRCIIVGTVFITTEPLTAPNALSGLPRHSPRLADPPARGSP
jgi:hypothetical protein